MMVAISCLAATMRASSVRPISFGTTSAASTPRITTTTMISISVKPRCNASSKRGRVRNGETFGICIFIKVAKG